MKEPSWQKDPQILLNANVFPTPEMTEVERHNAFIRLCFLIGILLMIAFRSLKPLAIPLLALFISLMTREKCRVIVLGNPDLVDQLKDVNIEDILRDQTADTEPVEPEDSPVAEAEAHSDAEVDVRLTDQANDDANSDDEAGVEPVFQESNQGQEEWIAPSVNGRPIVEQFILSEPALETREEVTTQPLRQGNPRSHKRTFINRSRSKLQGATTAKVVSGVSPFPRAKDRKVRTAKLTPHVAPLTEQLMRLKNPMKYRKDFTPGPEKLSNRQDFVEFLQQPTILER